MAIIFFKAIISTDEDVEKLEHLFTAGETVKWSSPFEKHVGSSLKWTLYSDCMIQQLYS